MKNTLFKFWKDKEVELGRNISVREVSIATKISRDTLARYREGGVTRFDDDVVDKLCEYFKVPPGPVPFLVYEPKSES